MGPQTFPREQGATILLLQLGERPNPSQGFFQARKKPGVIFLFLSICQERFLWREVGWEPPHPALQHPAPALPPPLAPRALRTLGMTDKGYRVPALCAAELL